MNRSALISPLAPAACVPLVPMDDHFIPGYLVGETVALEGDLVQINGALSKALSETDLRNYEDCAVSCYAFDRGYDFARHLRTKVYKKGGVWSADAVYTNSPTLPDGLVKIDAEVTVTACEESGIPMV